MTEMEGPNFGDELEVKYEDEASDDDESSTSSGNETSEGDDIVKEENEDDLVDGIKREDFSKTIDIGSINGISKKKKEARVKVKKLTKTEERMKSKKKVAAEKIAYTKPDISINQLKERRHVREATKGVVQLFNAVRQRQQFLDSKLKVLEKGSKAEKRKAIDEIKSFQLPAIRTSQEKQSSAKRLKTEAKEETTDDDYESEGNVTDASISEVKKEEEDTSDDESGEEVSESGEEISESDEEISESGEEISEESDDASD